MNSIYNKAAIAAYFSNRRRKRLISRFYKKIYRDAHRAIRHGMNNGVYYAHYSFNNYTYELDIDILSEVCNMVKETLTKEGYYLRKYQFGMVKSLGEFTIAWGSGIAEHQRLDEYQLKFMKERQKEEQN